MRRDDASARARRPSRSGASRARHAGRRSARSRFGAPSAPDSGWRAARKARRYFVVSPSTPKSSPVACWITRTRRISIGVPAERALPHVPASPLFTMNFDVVGSTLPLTVLLLLESGAPPTLATTPFNLRANVTFCEPALIWTFEALTIWIVAPVAAVGSVSVDWYFVAGGAACATAENTNALARTRSITTFAFIGIASLGDRTLPGRLTRPLSQRQRKYF